MHRKSDFYVTGQLPHQIYKVGIQYDIEICVKDNLMKIEDSEKKTLLVNKI